jgi:hypothetical protein
MRGIPYIEGKSYISENMGRPAEYYSQPNAQNLPEKAAPPVFHYSTVTSNRNTISPINNKSNLTPRMDSSSKSKNWQTKKIEAILESSSKNQDLRKQIENKLLVYLKKIIELYIY